MDRSLPSEPHLTGQVLAGKYHLDAIQASGYFGTVFRARQFFCRQFMRPVAVKVSRQTGLTEDTAPGLFGDALVLARLLATTSDHEGRRHLVQIFDMGLLPEHENRAYLVMEWVEGAPLFLHLRAAGRLSVATGLRHTREICRALALVHAQGAVHRDLKADNILVDRRGVVRVVDFGLAAYADPQLGFVPGAQGTFTYMAPETLQGRSTPASDVYSLGLLLYELFTGGGPHLKAAWRTDEGDHRAEHLRLKTSLHFPPPSQVQNEIRNDFRWIDGLIARCLAADPDRRFADAGKLLEAIESCQQDESLPPLPGEDSAANPEPVPERTEPIVPSAALSDGLFVAVRRLMATRAYDQIIDQLDIHRPAEWAVVDLTGARTLRVLGQAYLGKGDLPAARDCLEQLRSVQRQQALLPRPDYAAALSDLHRCYVRLGLTEQAKECQQEAQAVMAQG